jgi:hypothetical protein
LREQGEIATAVERIFIVPIYKKGYKNDCNNYRGLSRLSSAYKILSNILLAMLTPYVKEIMGIISVGSVVTDLLRNRFSAFGRY